jgi:6-pyruvoyl-tetrahydropterin synthase
MQVKLYEPTKPQRDALDVIYNKKPAVTILNYGRQTGKTYMMMMDALTWCINKKDQRVMFISPVYDNNSRIIKDIIELFDSRKEASKYIIKQIKIKEQEVHFLNGSVIRFRSAEMGDNLRGATLNRLYIDETAFVQEWVLNEVLLPMLVRTGGQVIMGSTSNHVEWFRMLKKEGLDPKNEKNVITLQRTYKDLNDPMVTDFVENTLKKRLTKDQFDQEVLNKDVNSEALFTNVEEAMQRFSKEDLEKLAKKSLYCGIDVATSNDYTVVTIGTEDYEVISIDRFNMKEDGLDPKEFKQRILETYRKYFPNLVLAYFEINNNQLLYEELEELPDGWKLFPHITSTVNKPKMIHHLIKLFEEGIIKIIDNNQLKTELYGFERKISPVSGKIIYANAKGGTHDDCVMSLAIYCWCVYNELEGGVTNIY